MNKRYYGFINNNSYARLEVLHLSCSIYVKTYSESGYKFVFEGDKYIIKCDKVGGYLRIYNKEERGDVKMNLYVALDKDSIITDDTWTYIKGNCKRYIISEEERNKLEKDNFILDLWTRFDGMMDWGDYDFFNSDKCKKLVTWLDEKIKHSTDTILLSFYSVLRDYAQLAVNLDTGIGFDL